MCYGWFLGWLIFMLARFVLATLQWWRAKRASREDMSEVEEGSDDESVPLDERGPDEEASLEGNDDTISFDNDTISFDGVTAPFVPLDRRDK